MNVLDLLREMGIEPKYVSSAKGGEYASPCPGCGGEDRFHVWPEQNGGSGSWWCREGSGCGKGGDNIELLREYCGMDFREACEKVGRDPEQAPVRCAQPRRPRAAFHPKQHEAPTEIWRRKSGELVDWAHGKLLGNHKQLDYLAERGVPLEAVRRFKLGWNPGESGKDLFRARSAWALPEETNHKTGKPKRLWMPIGIVVPFIWKGVLQRVRFRRTPEAMAQWGADKKYIVMPGSAMGPMLTRENAQAWMVVEAELDGVAVEYAAGSLDVGAIALGTLSGKPDDRAWKRLQAALWIGNALDFELFTPETEEDERTLKQQTKAKQWWKQTFSQCERWPVPLGKDPGDYIKDHGGDLREWIKEGLPPRLQVGRSAVIAKPRGGGVHPPAQGPQKRLPESIEALRTLLMTNRIELYVAQPSGRVCGGQMDAAVSARVGDLCNRTVVQGWLAEIGDEVVTYRNFMKPMEAAQ
tara:strand:+ start:3101 stop:4504 length:1404 start_codon:yes stop_codon:yes gene_type:complete